MPISAREKIVGEELRVLGMFLGHRKLLLAALQDQTTT